MADYLRLRAMPEAKVERDRQALDTVRGILVNVEVCCNASMRELSVRFDNCHRDSYRPTPSEVQDCIGQLSVQHLKDIECAQAQMHNCARIQRDGIVTLRAAGRRGRVVQASGMSQPPDKPAGRHFRSRLSATRFGFITCSA